MKPWMKQALLYALAAGGGIVMWEWLGTPGAAFLDGINPLPTGFAAPTAANPPAATVSA